MGNARKRGKRTSGNSTRASIKRIAKPKYFFNNLEKGTGFYSLLSLLLLFSPHAVQTVLRN